MECGPLQTALKSRGFSILTATPSPSRSIERKEKPTALGHPANEDLFAGTPIRAATSWRVYRSCRESFSLPDRWSGEELFGRWLDLCRSIQNKRGAPFGCASFVCCLVLSLGFGAGVASFAF